MAKNKKLEFSDEEMVAMINELSQPWEKLPVESDLAYRAFREFFCRINAEDRTVVKAYDNYLVSQGKLPKGRANESWYAWYGAFKWELRAKAYDDWHEEEVKNYVKFEQYKEIIEFRRRQRDLAGKIADSAQVMIDKALTALQQLDADQLTPRLIPQYIKAASQVAEMAQNAEASALALDEIVNRMSMEDDALLAIVERDGNIIKGINSDNDDNTDEVFIDILTDFDNDEDEYGDVESY